jgi:hypothetical protein
MVGCASGNSQISMEDTNMPDNEFVIVSNTQLTYKDLKIGSGNFRMDNCPDPQGNDTKCLTAGLWLYYRDNPNLDQQVRVKKGDTLEIGVYEILVIDIQKGDQDTFIKVQITDK